MLLTLAAILTTTVLAVEPGTPAAHPHGAVAGTVTLTDARGERFEAPGVELVLTCEGTQDAPIAAASDEHGAFRFAEVRPGPCSLSAELQGFATATANVVVKAADTLAVEMHLDVAPVYAGSASSSLREMSYELMRVEIYMLSTTSRQSWQRCPGWIDVRLQRCA
jgi:hypothetical protein